PPRAEDQKSRDRRGLPRDLPQRLRRERRGSADSGRKTSAARSQMIPSAKEASMRFVSLTLALGLVAAGTGCGAKGETAADAARYDYPIGSTDVARGEAVFIE